MDIDIAARRLAELGNPTRLQIVRLLVQAGRDGLAIRGIAGATWRAGFDPCLSPSRSGYGRSCRAREAGPERSLHDRLARD